MKSSEDNGKVAASTDDMTGKSIGTKLTAEAKQRNYDRVYETQVKQFSYQVAQGLTPVTEENGKTVPPTMDAVLQNAEKVFKWFKDGTVPGTGAPAGYKVN